MKRDMTEKVRRKGVDGRPNGKGETRGTTDLDRMNCILSTLSNRGDSLGHCDECRVLCELEAAADGIGGECAAVTKIVRSRRGKKARC
ncbi:MAG: hypothetical protein AB1793_02840 [Candidatus Thermoplasmatota archaeon]